MTKKPNPPKGSTRTEMTQAEKDWLENFDRAHNLNDRKSLAKIMPKGEVVNVGIERELAKEFNARHRDIYNQYTAVRVQPEGESSYDEEFDNFVAGDVSVQYYEQDPTVTPKQKVDRYTAEDYNPPSFPDEDAILTAIDYDNAEAEKKKIKNFDAYVQKLRGKKYDPAS